MIINDDDPVRSRLPAGPDSVDGLGGSQPSGYGGDMSVEDHKLIVRRFYDEVVSAGHLDVVDELATRTCTTMRRWRWTLRSRRLAGGSGPSRQAVRILPSTCHTDGSNRVGLCRRPELVVVYRGGSDAVVRPPVRRALAAGTAFSLLAISPPGSRPDIAEYPGR